MSVLRGAARRGALGLALAAAVILIPAQPAAANPAAGASVRAADLWQAALDWLAALWSPAPEADLPESGGGANSARGCGGDEGMCIDPNG